MIFDELTSAYTADGFNTAAQKFFLKNDRQGIILIDLDGFKRVNHLYGRETGDALLKYVVKDIYSAIPNVLVGRVTDDEFAVFITKIDSSSMLMSYAAKIVENSRSVKDIDGTMVMCTVTAGVIDVTADKYSGQPFHSVMGLAEFALTTGKRAGGNRYTMYTDEIMEHFKRNDFIKQEIQRIVSTDHALYKYQPIVDLKTHKVCGFELLARMTEGSSEMITPSELFHIAREANMMRYFDVAALRTACNTLHSLDDSGISGVYISVNVSPEFFLSSEFSDTITETAQNLNISMNTLVIELTEETFIDSYESAKAVIDRLSEMGIRFYIDDFGTGYSNLARLQELNMSALKLDKTLVDKLEVNNNLVRKSIEIAAIFDMKVVAEGVESKAQIDMLSEMGCDMVQGYYIGKAMKYDDMIEFIKNN